MDKALPRRGSGILLHPTSLSAPYGIGDIGAAALQFVDFLQEAKQCYWQVLPLGPTGFGHSPYAASSSFAGNYLLIDVDAMAADVGLDRLPINLHVGDVLSQVDYDAVLETKLPLLRHAASRFHVHAGQQLRDEYESFCSSHGDWLDNYSLFVAVKRHYDAVAAKGCIDDAMWNSFWDADIARRDEAAMHHFRHECRDEIAIQKVLQFYFNRQWTALKRYANDRGIRIIGDIPIFVALDSADVWSEPELFLLDRVRRPIVVAGVPPDYFSETGQRWGNPLYDWDAMRQNHFDWWMRRFASMRRMVDIVRIDHFRGFEACWHIPASSPTAVEGQWVASPGRELFEEFNLRFENYPILAEDLGLITPEVDLLRTDFEFPGMRVLQFAFDPFEPNTNQFLPHHYEPRTVVYTGTHDNDTTRGWYDSQSAETQAAVVKYLGCTSGDIAWDLIRLATSSVAQFAIFPMQDLLSLGSESRMNMPSTIGGNWSWRLEPGQLTSETARRMAELTTLYGRG